MNEEENRRRFIEMICKQCEHLPLDLELSGNIIKCSHSFEKLMKWCTDNDWENLNNLDINKAHALIDALKFLDEVINKTIFTQEIENKMTFDALDEARKISGDKNIKGYKDTYSLKDALK